MEACFHTCIYRDTDDDEIEIEVKIIGGYEPFVPARVYGPPEDCYPAEGGYATDVRAIFMDGDKERLIPLSDKEVEDLEEQMAEAVIDAHESAYESAMEARYEALEERDYNDH